MEQIEFLVGIKGQDAYKAAVSTYGEKDIPKPLCDKCQKWTGYTRLPYSKSDKGVNLFLNAYKTGFFRTESHVFIAFTWCADCLGFDDGYKGFGKGAFDVPKEMKKEYENAYYRGQNARRKYEVDELKAKIMQDELVKQEKEDIKKQVLNEIKANNQYGKA